MHIFPESSCFLQNLEVKSIQMAPLLNGGEGKETEELKEDTRRTGMNDWIEPLAEPMNVGRIGLSSSYSDAKIMLPVAVIFGVSALLMPFWT